MVKVMVMGSMTTEFMITTGALLMASIVVIIAIDIVRGRGSWTRSIKGLSIGPVGGETACLADIAGVTLQRVVACLSNSH